ncbi:unnamed protein product [Spirodela intermedia]|uniref:Defective in cullin neddylation protein n=1 Tax=Spirodela intermedia TaxID=51605 RepID=A0A7I8JJ76_SPIIN|nr:unnamed protein product [Spirodela intermedia]CAA6670227.1 unnamed protein product [Spirodela intermedia]
MPRTSRRTGSAAVNSPAASDIFRSATNRAISKELERIDVLFHSYSDSSSGVIGPEGIESLCSDVGVEHTDIRMLIVAGGLKALRSDSIGKLKKALTELEKEVRSPENFSDFYSYAFRYCLTEDKQRSIDIESTCELLDLILGPIYRPQIGKLTDFLKGQSDYKVINMDQWMGFLRFCKEINFPSVDNYDPALAWPLILDNFVEWMQQQQHGR